MGTKGAEIVALETKELISLLNKALADEWLAYYQYWIGAKIVKGKMRGAVVSELEEHANDELKHANMLVNRILVLGGKPITNPKDWSALSNCGYDEPTNPEVSAILKQNIKGEQCAIAVYQKLAETTKGKDHITYHMAVEILEDEVEHEEDLQSLLEDIEKS
ncbi:MAG: ferritin-like domain-containing protein [Candidatus Micrarchaeota archaeon]